MFYQMIENKYDKAAQNNQKQFSIQINHAMKLREKLNYELSAD